MFHNSFIVVKPIVIFVFCFFFASNNNKSFILFAIWCALLIEHTNYWVVQRLNLFIWIFEFIVIRWFDIRYFHFFYFSTCFFFSLCFQPVTKCSHPFKNDWIQWLVIWDICPIAERDYFIKHTIFFIQTVKNIQKTFLKFLLQKMELFLCYESTSFLSFFKLLPFFFFIFFHF